MRSFGNRFSNIRNEREKIEFDVYTFISHSIIKSHLFPFRFKDKRGQSFDDSRKYSFFIYKKKSILIVSYLIHHRGLYSHTQTYTHAGSAVVSYQPQSKYENMLKWMWFNHSIRMCVTWWEGVRALKQKSNVENDTFLPSSTCYLLIVLLLSRPISISQIIFLFAFSVAFIPPSLLYLLVAWIIWK